MHVLNNFDEVLTLRTSNKRVSTFTKLLKCHCSIDVNGNLVQKNQNKILSIVYISAAL